MSPFPNLSTDLNAQLKYNQWPNPNTNPPDQTTYKFVPSADLANTPDENTYSALVPENDLGINISQFGGNPVDSGSDNLRWSFSATHISGNIFEMETVLENVDTGLIVSSTDELIGAWTVDTSLLQDPNNPDNDFPEWGDATELMAGFRAQSMAGTDSISISNFKFEFDAPGGTGPNGDFNNDGAYDCSDVDALVGEIVAGSNDADFDMNQDGFVDAADMNDATNGWLAVAGAENTPTGGAHLPGDANLDGFVDVGDFNVWNSSKFTETAAWCSGDFNYDGFVDVGDFNLWNSNKFSSSDVAAVPEPTSGFLLMLGALFVVKARRRH